MDLNGAIVKHEVRDAPTYTPPYDGGYAGIGDGLSASRSRLISVNIRCDQVASRARPDAAVNRARRHKPSWSRTSARRAGYPRRTSFCLFSFLLMILPAQIKIETSRLTIRLVEESDLPSLFVVNADDAVTRYLPYGSWKSVADGEAWFSRAAARLAAGEAGQFVIVHRESRRVVGTCLLFRFEESSARAEVGYVLAREYWGAGYMLEAMKAFVAFAFEQLGMQRLEAEIDPRNVSSAKLLERLGFVREGLLRQRWAMKGEVTDSGFYGLLHKEWQSFLAAGNYGNL
jgi:[ribosomal protein S5]-alanine N-acetyltransferase